ncbi:MAG: formylglycine-generating enzyme family protein, partial [Acidobacteria bacterium]|nr:formylglycine-generating enzyme family protein [Acidobacteriota bacterium]
MKTLEFRLAPDLTLEMAAIPAGRFLMGGAEPEARPNEKPCHAVAVNSFYLGKFPVTQAQWSAVMGSLPKLPADFRGREFPVVNVWLEKALEFCARLARLTGENFRLPNEAEWEYA